MSRQLFLHHYLPSHLTSALVAGSVLSFALSETINYPVSVWGPRLRAMKRPTYADLGMRGPIFVAVFIVILFILFVYMAPLTYGTPGYVLLNDFYCMREWLMSVSYQTGRPLGQPPPPVVELDSPLRGEADRHALGCSVWVVAMYQVRPVAEHRLNNIYSFFYTYHALECACYVYFIARVDVSRLAVAALPSR